MSMPSGTTNRVIHGCKEVGALSVKLSQVSLNACVAVVIPSSTCHRQHRPHTLPTHPPSLPSSLSSLLKSYPLGNCKVECYFRHPGAAAPAAGGEGGGGGGGGGGAGEKAICKYVKMGEGGKRKKRGSE